MFSSITPTSRCSSSDRAPGVRAAHAGNAARAAATARSPSSTVDSLSWVSTSPVEGLKIWRISPEDPLTALPSMTLVTVSGVVMVKLALSGKNCRIGGRRVGLEMPGGSVD